MATTEQETVVPGLYVVATVSLFETSVHPLPVAPYETALEKSSLRTYLIVLRET